MAERNDDTDEVMLADPRAGEDFATMMGARPNQELIPAGMQHSLTPRQVGDLFGTLTTAQPVIKDRDVGRLMQTLKALAQTFGDSYIYSWEVKDNKNGTHLNAKGEKVSTIEGATIQLANDLAREYGNCCLDIREIEGPSHWVFYGRFIDLQTGYTLTRAFRQRKNALAGNYENDRKLDMAYQMGQSKCLRNVTINALRNYAEFMLEEAKKALPDKIAKDPEKYSAAIRRGLAANGVSDSDAARMVGRAMEEWTVKDMAKVFSALKAIAEGLTTAAEAFPKEGPVVDEETGEVHEEGRPAKAASPMKSGAAKAPKESTGAKAPAEGTAAEETPPGKTVAASAAEPEPTQAKEPATKEPEKAKETPKPASPPKAEATKKPAAKKPAALFGEE